MPRLADPSGSSGSAPALRRPIDEVHLWRAELDELRPYQVAWLRCLPAIDQAALARLPYEPVRSAWLCARGMLRQVLAGYLRCDPRGLTFRLGPWGKPALAAEGPEVPAFNLSHSGQQVLLAVAPAGVRVGVDVEQCRELPDWPQLAAQGFHPEEVADLARLQADGPARAQAAFFDVWTRKEAVVKAVGLGLQASLRTFRVGTRPGPGLQVLQWPEPPVDAHWPVQEMPPQRPWCLQSLVAPPGYAAALAVSLAAPVRVQDRRFAPALWHCRA